MFSSNNNNSEIDMDETYMKYGQCRCCTAKGHHRDVNMEYYYNNIKEVYRDLFAECFNLLLSPHDQISSLICDSCVHRLREASTFRMMVTSNEEQLLKAVIFKSEPENDNLFFDAQQNFTTDVKIETDSESDFICEPDDIFQDDNGSSSDNEPVNEDVLMKDEVWVDDEEETTDEEPENLVEQTNGAKLVTVKERTRTEAWVNNNGQVNEYERTNDDNWRDAFDEMNDEDDWSTDTENELVIDEDRENESSGTDEFLTDEDLDDCGSIFSSTITRSSTSAVDDEPSAMVKGEKRLLSRTAPFRLLPKRRHLAKMYPEFDKHLRSLEYKQVKPKSIEWFFKKPELKVPEAKAPVMKVPETKVMKVSEIKAPVMKVPETKVMKVSKIKAPVMKVSEIKAPVMKVPETKVKKVSKIKAPVMKVSKIKAPVMKVPETKVMKASEISASVMKVPETKVMKASEIKASIMKVPETKVMKASEVKVMKVSEVKTPVMKVSEIKAPVIKVPKIKAPVIKVPKIRAPVMKVSEVKAPVMKVSEIKTPVIKASETKVIKVSETKVMKVSEIKTPVVIKEIKKHKRAYWKLPKEEKEAQVANATTLFEFSNAIAFKTKMKNGYPCFYCRKTYDYNRLREHQEAKHSKSTISDLISKLRPIDFVIYAEITDLKCTICDKSMKDLKELRTHLSEEHEKKMLKGPDKIIPFKLKETNFKCQICGQTFETFTAVEKHMNTHYGDFECNVCGNTFITKHRLAVHEYASHKDENISCKLCKKTFRTKLKLRHHFEIVHENKRPIKCAVCFEQFIDYFTRNRHLVDVHNESPKGYNCKECGKTFSRRTGLKSHISRCHIGERNINCEHCTFKCLTQHELRDHMVTHSTEQLKFECAVCKKVYNRKRTLATHVKAKKHFINSPVVSSTNNLL